MRVSVLLWVFFLLLSPLLSALETQTEYTADKYYITYGTAALSVPFERASAVLSDFPGYTHWALRGLDGRDEISKAYIGLLKSIFYRPADRTFSLVYDVNLSWPFGSRDNVMYFNLTQVSYRGDLLESMKLTAAEQTLALHDASLDFRIEPHGAGSYITATAKVKFTWLIDLFFDIEGYRKSVEWRIQRILINLTEYVEQ